MEINNLEMISFRNHRKTNIDFDPGLTIIWEKMALEKHQF